MSAPDLVRLAWPRHRLADAIAFVARDRKLTVEPESVFVSSADAPVEELAEAAGIDAERTSLLYGNADRMLAASSPALIRAPFTEESFLVVLSNRGRKIVLLDPDLERVQIARETLVSMLRHPVEASRGRAFDRFLETVESKSRDGLRRRLMAERYGDDQVGECWVLRRSLRESFWRHILDAGAGTSVLLLAATHIVRYVTFFLAWGVIGRVAIAGTADAPWLLAWMLLLLPGVPIHYFATSLQGLISVACGFVLRQRLMFGSLRLDVEALRTDGAGRHLARVFEGDAVEALGRSGGFLALFAVIELVLAAAILQKGAGGSLHVALLIGWLLVIAIMTTIFHRRHEIWSSERLELTGDLVERMVGHRTRLVQQPRSSWHDDEDVQLESYASSSRNVDRSLIWITAVIPRGWIVLGMLGVMPAIVNGNHTAGALAISLGGIILALQAMKRLAIGLPDLVGAAAAWTKVAPLFDAASQPRERHPVVSARGANESRTVVDARGIAFRYRHRGEPTLRTCTFRVEAGDKIVLEGRSGSGKSTLASILAGLRSPDQGLLLLDGLDRATLGSDGWRRRAVLAPQFHENHVLSESFAFNLLMGRCWPPKPEDWRDAEELCVEIGLGDLLKRMPGGLAQMVGETGWRLSHGEQSRLFMARALLQNPELVILDESFAALDPEALRRSLDCVIRRAPALVVVAHP